MRAARYPPTYSHITRFRGGGRVANRESEVHWGVQLFGEAAGGAPERDDGRAGDEPGGVSPVSAVVRAEGMVRGEGDRDHGVFAIG